MGGRGSSSSGGGRWGRGGGLGANDIVSTTSLISERERLQAEVDQVLTVGRDIYNQYGVATDYDIATLKDDGKGTLAYFSPAGNTLAINKAYMDAGKMNSVYDDCVASGFHPSRGNKTGLEAVASHEMGHKLTGEVAKKLGLSQTDLDKASDTILKQATTKAGYRKNSTYNLASKISGYATQSKSEAIAEAFADVFCNGSKAKKESKAVVDVLNSYFKK